MLRARTLALVARRAAGMGQGARTGDAPADPAQLVREDLPSPTQARRRVAGRCGARQHPLHRSGTGTGRPGGIRVPQTARAKIAPPHRLRHSLAREHDAHAAQSRRIDL